MSGETKNTSGETNNKLPIEFEFPEVGFNNENPDDKHLAYMRFEGDAILGKYGGKLKYLKDEFNTKFLDENKNFNLKPDMVYYLDGLTVDKLSSDHLFVKREFNNNNIIIGSANLSQGQQTGFMASEAKYISDKWSNEWRKDLINGNFIKKTHPAYQQSMTNFEEIQDALVEGTLNVICLQEVVWKEAPLNEFLVSDNIIKIIKGNVTYVIGRVEAHGGTFCAIAFNNRLFEMKKAYCRDTELFRKDLGGEGEENIDPGRPILYVDLVDKRENKEEEGTKYRIVCVHAKNINGGGIKKYLKGQMDKEEGNEEEKKTTAKIADEITTRIAEDINKFARSGLKKNYEDENYEIYIGGDFNDPFAVESRENKSPPIYDVKNYSGLKSITSKISDLLYGGENGKIGLHTNKIYTGCYNYNSSYAGKPGNEPKVREKAEASPAAPAPPAAPQAPPKGTNGGRRKTKRKSRTKKRRTKRRKSRTKKRKRKRRTKRRKKR
jgi:hypothetical protein